jgi:hypothetical protein
VGLEQEGEVAEARGGIGMIGAEHFLVDCERSLEKLSRRRMVVVQVKHQGKVIEARSCMGTLGT